jgi:hypothetical protein
MREDMKRQSTGSELGFAWLPENPCSIISTGFSKQEQPKPVGTASLSHTPSNPYSMRHFYMVNRGSKSSGSNKPYQSFLPLLMSDPASLPA